MLCFNISPIIFTYDIFLTFFYLKRCDVAHTVVNV